MTVQPSWCTRRWYGQSRIPVGTNREYAPIRRAAQTSSRRADSGCCGGRCGRRLWRLPLSAPPRHTAPTAAAERAHARQMCVTRIAIGSAAESSRLRRSIPCPRSPYPATSYVAYSSKERAFGAPAQKIPAESTISITQSAAVSIEAVFF
jgi:hypothetical protein